MILTFSLLHSRLVMDSKLNFFLLFLLVVCWFSLDCPLLNLERTYFCVFSLLIFISSTIAFLFLSTVSILRQQFLHSTSESRLVIFISKMDSIISPGLESFSFFHKLIFTFFVQTKWHTKQKFDAWGDRNLAWSNEF